MRRHKDLTEENSLVRCEKKMAAKKKRFFVLFKNPPPPPLLLLPDKKEIKEEEEKTSCQNVKGIFCRQVPHLKSDYKKSVLSLIC